MKEVDALISPVDVAVVDPDLLWRVEHMNALKGHNVREFPAMDDALAGLTPEHPAVVLLGPAALPEELEALADAAVTRPEIRTVALLADSSTGGAPRIHRSLSEGAEFEEIAAVVDELFADASATTRTADEGEQEIADEPTETSQRALDLRRDGPSAPAAVLPANLIIVTSAKGGEGVTTLAINLATSLGAVPGSSVALVDGEPWFDDLTVEMGQRFLPPPTLRALPIPTIDGEQLVHAMEPEGIVLVRQPLLGVELEGREVEVLREVLALAGERASVVVADIPFELLVAADLTVEAAMIALVTSRRTASMKNAYVAAERLGRPGNLGVVLNELSRAEHRMSAQTLAKDIGVPLVGHLPFNGSLHRAAVRPRTALLAEPHSRYARAVSEVRDRVAAVLTSMEAASPVR